MAHPAAAMSHGDVTAANAMRSAEKAGDWRLAMELLDAMCHGAGADAGGMRPTLVVGGMELIWLSHG